MFRLFKRKKLKRPVQDWELVLMKTAILSGLKVMVKSAK